MPAAKSTTITGRFSRRAMLGAFASVPAIGAATAALAPRTPTFTEKVENVRRAAEALKQAITDLHGVPCKIGIGSDTDCFIVMTEKAVRSCAT
ncbi:hypothetical protein X739_22315 [Mesorhizobium sp. LNHC220B00]|nr:hypothetical protein X739_22315 [Mesorhizobium sp. LNHC220B00]